MQALAPKFWVNSPGICSLRSEAPCSWWNTGKGIPGRSPSNIELWSSCRAWTKTPDRPDQNSTALQTSRLDAPWCRQSPKPNAPAMPTDEMSQFFWCRATIRITVICIGMSSAAAKRAFTAGGVNLWLSNHVFGSQSIHRAWDRTNSFLTKSGWMALLPENTCLGKKPDPGLYLIKQKHAHRECGENRPAHDRII